jgi:hypothetical protein
VLLSRLPDLVQVKKDRSSADMLVTLVAPRPGKPDTDGGQSAATGRRRATAKQAASKQTEQPAAQQAASKPTEQPAAKQPARKRAAAKQAATP